MRSATTRSPRALIVILLAGLLTVGAVPAAQAGSPTADRECPNRIQPPPPQDSPEQDPPGPPRTEPLPVPSPPVGGKRLAECGPVLPPDAPPLPKDITAASWVIQNLDTGAILAANAPHARQRPASLIKLLLALVVVEKFERDDVVTPTVDDVDTVCSCVGLVAGAHYRVDKLLHGMLMVSGNDAAHAFGAALGGQGAALRMMNDLAARLGALDTRATTTSGLDALGMVTSAYDLSVIYNHAMRHPRIAEILGTKKIMFPGKGKKPAYPLFNDNDLLGSYPGFLGGKTGFTDNARHTYVGGARHGDNSLAVVLLRGEQRPIQLSEQAARLLDYGFGLADDDAPVGEIVAGSLSAHSGSASTGPHAGAARTAGAAAASGGSSHATLWIVVLIAALLGVTALVLRRQSRRSE